VSKFQIIGKVIRELASNNDYRKRLWVELDGVGLTIRGRKVHGGLTFTQSHTISYEKLEASAEEMFETQINNAILMVESNLEFSIKAGAK
jgi:hypothetical protein